MNNFTIYVPDNSSAFSRDRAFRKSLTEETTSEDQIKEFSKILSNSTENLGEKNGPSILRMRFEVGFGKSAFSAGKASFLVWRKLYFTLLGAVF